MSSTPLCYLSRLARWVQTARGRSRVPAAIASRSRRHPSAAPLPSVGQSGKSRVFDTALLSLSAGAVSALQGGACCDATLSQQTPPFRLSARCRGACCDATLPQQTPRHRECTPVLQGGACCKATRLQQTPLFRTGIVAPAGRRSGQQTLSGLPPRTPLHHRGECRAGWPTVRPANCYGGYCPQTRKRCAERVAPAGRRCGQQTLSGLLPRTPLHHRGENRACWPTERPADALGATAPHPDATGGCLMLRYAAASDTPLPQPRNKYAE